LKQILPAGASDKVIGIKTNGLGGRGISSHSVLAYAIAERLQWAGVKPGNIIIWDRNARDLEACGFTINTDSSRVRIFGSDVSGFEDEPRSIRFRRQRQALQNPHPPMRHGDRPAHSQRPQRRRRLPSP